MLFFLLPCLSLLISRPPCLSSLASLRRPILLFLPARPSIPASPISPPSPLNSNSAPVAIPSAGTLTSIATSLPADTQRATTSRLPLGSLPSPLKPARERERECVWARAGGRVGGRVFGGAWEEPLCQPLPSVLANCRNERFARRVRTAPFGRAARVRAHYAHKCIRTYLSTLFLYVCERL